MVRDPVCDMLVDPKTTRHSLTYEGKTYYFCAAACKKAFELAPQKYLKNAGGKEKAGKEPLN